MLDGQTVVNGRFKIEAHVATGGMGTVYRARDLAYDGMPVAFKVVSSDVDSSSSTASLDELDGMFVQEAEVLAQLRHPTIVRYIDHGRIDGNQPYLVMEWVRGKDLKSLLHEHPGPMPLRDALLLGRRVAQALARAHRVGVLHRDVKPSNILLPDGSVRLAKLGDFGIAQLMRNGGTDCVGTRQFSSPEQLYGRSDLDATTDVYALGSVLAACLGIGPGDDQPTVASGTPGTPRLVVTPGGALSAIEHERLGEDGVALTVVREVIARMRSPERGDRPASGRAVAEMLEALHAQLCGPRTDDPFGTELSEVERRVITLVVTPGLGRRSHQIEQKIAALGGLVQPETSESSVFLFRGDPDTRDHAVRAALAAHAIRDAQPAAPVLLETIREVQSEPYRLQARIHELTGRLAIAPRDPPRILVDGPTATRLESGFEITTQGSVRVLGRRRAEPSTRRLLGKENPCLGRDREHDRLNAAFEACVADGTPRSVVLLGQTGVGKTTLLEVFLDGLHTREMSPLVWRARGEPVGAGSPLGMITRLLHSAVGIKGTDPMDVRGRALCQSVVESCDEGVVDHVQEFLCELAGAPFPIGYSDRLRECRRDVARLAEAMKNAWASYLEAVSTHRPLVLVLDDLHLGDLASVRFIDTALASVKGPLLVLATGRPEVCSRFPRLWSSYAEIMRLEGLSEEHSRGLVRRFLGGQVSERLVGEILRRAEGNPHFLEELIRAVDAGGSHDALAFGITHTGAIQGRLEGLERDARLVLRAAAVFPGAFTRDALAYVLGGDARVPQLDDWLEELTSRELLVSEDGLATSFRISHGLIRDAAYAMLTERDRALAHRRAGEWIERGLHPDPLVLAEHYQLGNDAERAARWFLAAARRAQQGSDLQAVLSLVGRGVACGPHDAYGELRLLEAEVNRWLGHHQAAAKAAEDALGMLPKASAEWFDAAGEAAVSLGRLGARGSVLEVVGQLGTIESPQPGAGAHFRGLVRAAVPFIYSGEAQVAQAILGGVVGALESVCEFDAEGRASSVDPGAVASLCSARGFLELVKGDLGAHLRYVERATEAFRELGHLGEACDFNVGAGFICIELGEYARAEQLLRGGLVEAQDLGIPHLMTAANHNLGLAVARLGRLEEGCRIEATAADEFETQGNRRAAGSARVYLASILRAMGELDRGVDQAQHAVELAAENVPTHARALAILALLHLDRGDAKAARPLAEQAYRGIKGLTLLEGESLVHRSHVDALLACGERVEARGVARAARAQLLGRAGRIVDPEVRASFLSAYDNGALLEIAAHLDA